MFAGSVRAAILLSIVAAASVLSERARAAGAAYVVDTAEVSEPGACKVESWVSTASNHDVFASTTPTCVVNGFHPVELSAQLIRARADDEWTNGVAPKIKTNLVPTSIGSWGIAVSGATAYDLTNQQTVAMFATVPVTLRLSNVLRINLNAGWDWDRVAGQHYATYGAGVDWRTPDNVWTLTAEVFGLLGVRQEAIGVTEPRFQVGLRWRPIDDFNVDLIYGRNIYGDNANWVTLATTIRFHVGQ
ncbi:MAG: hypothetical protein WA322_19765 [Pseudolabrys sp.]